MNPNLFFDIDDLVDAKQKMQQFVDSVCKPLSDDIFDAVEKFQRRASMANLKREVEKVTRQSRMDTQAIIGQHMNQEFDRALTEVNN